MHMETAFAPLAEALRNTRASRQSSRWLREWEAMQDAEVPRRQERMQLIAELLRARGKAARILDIGGGAGSLIPVLSEALPSVRVTAIEGNPFLAFLARQRLEGTPHRVLNGDLESATTWDSLRGTYDAAVAVTALHWFPPASLRRLARRLHNALKSGAYLVVSDTVSSSEHRFQQIYRRQRNEYLTTASVHWDKYWNNVGKSLCVDICACFGGLRGMAENDDGLPVNQLRHALSVGFEELEVHWADRGEVVFTARKRSPQRRARAQG